VCAHAKSKQLDVEEHYFSRGGFGDECKWLCAYLIAFNLKGQSTSILFFDISLYFQLISGINYSYIFSFHSLLVMHLTGLLTPNISLDFQTIILK
jgi:hypothetical protein